MKHSRKHFLRKLAAGSLAATGLTALGPAVQAARPATSRQPETDPPPLQLGLASYSLRKFSLDEVIQMCHRTGLRHLALKSMHLPLDANPAYIRATAAKVRVAGIDLYGAGVIYMREPMQVHQAFAYAQAAGLRVIIGVPNPELLPLVEKLAKELDIQVAIHNHGPGDKLYPSPESIYSHIKNLDERIGICIDIGHTRRIELDPAQEVLKYADRILDVHLKDVNQTGAEGHNIEMGRGIIDVPAFLAALRSISYQGVVSFEYEKDPDDPLPGLAESVGYVRGVLDVACE
ncbi:MAG: sugar phosphate isomerase/epimerase [Bacteroidetes bacterium]|nr:MAG: sugar phosphate isomerase/epimerase [Bacteroidota bacterium]